MKEALRAEWGRMVLLRSRCFMLTCLLRAQLELDAMYSFLCQFYSLGCNLKITWQGIIDFSFSEAHMKLKNASMTDCPNKTTPKLRGCRGLSPEGKETALAENLSWILLISGDKPLAYFSLVPSAV